MTFEEVRNLLKNLQRLKQQARRVNTELNELRNFEENISINSSWNKGEGKNNIFHSSVETTIMRVFKKREELTAVLEKVFETEDRLVEALDYLSLTEKEVIIGCYMNSKTHNQLAREMGYSEVGIKYIKREAIMKLTKLL